MQTPSITTPEHFQQHPTPFNVVLERQAFENGAIARLRADERLVKTLIHRLRKHYSCLLCEEVGRTVSDPGEVDEEIHALCEALIATEGRLGP
ncbi:MAG TPA: hypothetical protein VIS96_04665 [Terrimicrobiaceae bacterium]